MPGFLFFCVKVDSGRDLDVKEKGKKQRGN
jgi:hypothetical protein